MLLHLLLDVHNLRAGQLCKVHERQLSLGRNGRASARPLQSEHLRRALWLGGRPPTCCGCSACCVAFELRRGGRLLDFLCERKADSATRLPLPRGAPLLFGRKQVDIPLCIGPRLLRLGRRVSSLLLCDVVVVLGFEPPIQRVEHQIRRLLGLLARRALLALRSRHLHQEPDRHR